jgi:hypothetical protein
MDTQLRYRFPGLAVFTAIMACLALSLGCAGKPNPKDTVMDLFTALHADDTTMVLQSVDTGRAWRSVSLDLKQPADSLLTAISWGERLESALTGDGRLRSRWIKMQVVIGETEIKADSATVEVSFIDRDTRIQFYSRMALVFQDGHWRIVAFAM